MCEYYDGRYFFCIRSNETLDDVGKNGYYICDKSVCN